MIIIDSHKCEEWKELTQKIKWDDSKFWWASCNEYAKAIYFCTFCGVKLL